MWYIPMGQCMMLSCLCLIVWMVVVVVTIEIIIIVVSRAYFGSAYNDSNEYNRFDDSKKNGICCNFYHSIVPTIRSKGGTIVI